MNIVAKFQYYNEYLSKVVIINDHITSGEKGAEYSSKSSTIVM